MRSGSLCFWSTSPNVSCLCIIPLVPAGSVVTPCFVPNIGHMSLLSVFFVSFDKNLSISLTFKKTTFFSCLFYCFPFHQFLLLFLLFPSLYLIWVLFFKSSPEDMFIDFIERERGREGWGEREREREILTTLLPSISTLTGNRTCNLWVCRKMPQPTGSPSQGFF